MPFAVYFSLGMQYDHTTALARITCPVLLVRGSDSWAGDPESDGRIAVFPDARQVTIPDAAHWVHHDKLDEFLRVVKDFLAD